MRLRGARAAAVALAVAALAPGPARSDPLSDAERGVPQVEDLLSSVEDSVRRPEETSAERAARKFSSGETEYLLGDWPRAALLVGEALDDASFRAGPQGATATFYLGDALRNAGSCGAARPYLASYLQGAEPAHRGEALAAALDCAVRIGHQEEIEPLLAEAVRYHQGQLPPDLRYLAAKAVRARKDLSPDERFRAADAAFAAVGPPFAHQATYFQAVLRIERNDLAGAAERFATCAALSASDARQREVQDLCRLGLGRVRTESGDLPGAIAAYDQVPIDSPWFDESLYEVASVHGRAGQLEPALRAAETLVEIAPESSLAGRAMLLQGQLLLKQGKYEPASQVYQRAMESHAQVRDQLDSILTLQEDPVRYFADLLSRSTKPFEVASAIPEPALKSALARPEMARAGELMRDLEAEAADAEENHAVSDRLSALLSRGSGVDAFPRLRQGYAGVQAVENALAVLQGQAQSAAVEAAHGALEPGDQSELLRIYAERLVLEARLDALPRTFEAARARLDRFRSRVDDLDRQIFALGYEAEGVRAAIAGAEVWLEEHRKQIQADRTQREQFAAELRKHREVVAAYEEELRELRRQVALTRDAAGTEAMGEEERLRADYLALLSQERTLIGRARGRLSSSAQGRLDRAWAASDKLAQVGARARALSDWITGEARRRAEGLRARLAAEVAAQAEQQKALSAAQIEARAAVGKLAYRAFGEVRREFYQVALKADVGLNDVAWVRKKDRVERIRALSVQQAEELRAFDQRYRAILGEEE